MAKSHKMNQLMIVLWLITTLFYGASRTPAGFWSKFSGYETSLWIIHTRGFQIAFFLPYAYFLFVLLHHRRYRQRLLHCSLQQIDSLSGYDFEYYLYYLLKQKKFHVKITPYSHDFGADLILKRRNKKIVIQAKRWNESVGIKAVQETIGAMAYYKAGYGAVITNSFYTKSASQLAEASGITLLNRHDLDLLHDTDANQTLDLLLDGCCHSNTDQEDLENHCPFCGGILVKRKGRYGTFYGCSNYPYCKYTKESST